MNKKNKLNILFSSVVIALCTISFLSSKKIPNILLISILFSTQGILCAIKNVNILIPLLISISTYTIIIFLYTNDLVLNNILICVVSYVIGYYIKNLL